VFHYYGVTGVEEDGKNMYDFRLKVLLYFTEIIHSSRVSFNNPSKF
jgi:hypothetical protein